MRVWNVIEIFKNLLADLVTLTYNDRIHDYLNHSL